MTKFKCIVFKEQRFVDTSGKCTKNLVHTAQSQFNDWVAENGKDIYINSIQTHANTDGHVVSIVLFFERVENDA